jgi:mannose-1-phosphate guanylyltransferase
MVREARTGIRIGKRTSADPENFHRGLENHPPTRQSSGVTQAFILGAGLGTRLRPLTDRLPKPLVPLFHQPLAWWTMAACAKAGIRSFAINTHHLPKAWNRFIRRADIRDLDVTLFHESVLLETGGGLKNIEPWIGNEPVLVHNGDIFSTLHLDKLIAAHEASGLPVTLALRSGGAEKRIALDESLSRVTDVRHELGRAKGTHVFTGIYCVNPEFLDLIPPREIISVIPAFLELAKLGQLGAIILDEGLWLDLGDRDSYLQAHRELDLAPAIHPDAIVETGAIIENSIIGPGAIVSSGATIRDSVVWPGSRISDDAVLDHCIVCSGNPVAGNHRDADL